MNSHTNPFSVKSSLNLLACQIDIPSTRSASDRDRHIERVCGLISKEVPGKHIDLIVLPELTTIEYSRQAFERLSELSETIDGPSVGRFAELAIETEATIVFGMPRLSNGEYMISQLVIGPDGGLIDCYDKLHLAQFDASIEKEFFARGDKTVAFDLCGFKLAPIICYDFRFPELCRSLVIDQQIELIIHSNALYRDATFTSWPHFAVTRAMENQIYFLSLNRAGKKYGGSLFCPPWPDKERPIINFPKHREALILCRVERSQLERARERYPYLQDRHDHYSRSK